MLFRLACTRYRTQSLEQSQSRRDCHLKWLRFLATCANDLPGDQLEFSGLRKETSVAPLSRISELSGHWMAQV